MHLLAASSTASSTIRRPPSPSWRRNRHAQRNSVSSRSPSGTPCKIVAVSARSPLMPPLNEEGRFMIDLAMSRGNGVA